MSPRRAFPPPRCIAVDVDGTLIVRGWPNRALVDWLRERKADGFELMLWSARGSAYAHEAAASLGIDGLFDVVASKPGCVVDDIGLAWLRQVRVLLPGDVAASEGLS